MCFFLESDFWRSYSDEFFSNVLTNSLRLNLSIRLVGELSDRRDCNDKRPIKNRPVLYGSSLVPLLLSRKVIGDVRIDLTRGVS